MELPTVPSCRAIAADSGQCLRCSARLRLPALTAVGRVQDAARIAHGPNLQAAHLRERAG